MDVRSVDKAGVSHGLADPGFHAQGTDQSLIDDLRVEIAKPRYLERMGLAAGFQAAAVLARQ